MSGHRAFRNMHKLRTEGSHFLKEKRRKIAPTYERHQSVKMQENTLRKHFQNNSLSRESIRVHQEAPPIKLAVILSQDIEEDDSKSFL